MHTDAIRCSPHLIKPHNDITQAFRLLIAAVGKSLSLSLCLAVFPLPVSLLSFHYRLPRFFPPFFCDVSPLGTPWLSVCLCALIGLACSSTGVQHYGGRGRVVIEQVCYFPDSTQFLFTCVCACDLVIQTKRADIGVICDHIHTAVHTPACSASRGFLLNCWIVF